MKWTSQDMDMYVKAKEYVDTIVVPLIPITLDGDVSSTVEMGDFISILSAETERQYKGRMLVLPAFSYLITEEKQLLIERLNLWNDQFQTNGVQHVMFLTADPDWKLFEKEIEGTMLWLPAISFEGMDKKTVDQMISAQLKPLQSIIMNLWNRDK